MPAKKYKLFSAKGDGSSTEKPVCAFFQSAAGCKNGAGCKFSHTIAIANSGVISEEDSGDDSSSVPSSESEEEEEVVVVKKKKKVKTKSTPVKSAVKCIPVPVQADAAANERAELMRLQKEQWAALEEKHQAAAVITPKPTSTPKSKKKTKRTSDVVMKEVVMEEVEVAPRSKKKRKSSGITAAVALPIACPPSELVYEHPATVKNQKSTKKVVSLPIANPPSELVYKAKQPVTSPKPKPPKAKVKAKTKTPPKQTLQNLLSSLPVASPSLNDDESTSESHNSDSEEEAVEPQVTSAKEHPLELPNEGAGVEWIPHILTCVQHPSYRRDYDYTKAKNALPGTWIRSSMCTSKSSNPAVIAMDCEMCETKCPLTGTKNPRALCRLSITDGITGDVLIDTLVKPAWPVLDHRTWVNGITKRHLSNVTFTLEHAQSFLGTLLSADTVVCGHAVINDLVALQVEHYTIVDSSYLYKCVGREDYVSPSLKDVARTVLDGMEMPSIHDSVNDARVAMDCCAFYKDSEGDVPRVLKTPRNKAPERRKKTTKSDKLLVVHRLPAGVLPEHLTEMMLSNTFVSPTNVADIVIAGNFGKTTLEFHTSAHATLAFDTLPGKALLDVGGYSSKKVFLRNGSYVRIRMNISPGQVAARKEASEASSELSKEVDTAVNQERETAAAKHNVLEQLKKRTKVSKKTTSVPNAVPYRISEFIQAFQSQIQTGDRVSTMSVTLTGEITSIRCVSKQLFFYDVCEMDAENNLVDTTNAKVQIMSDAKSYHGGEAEFSRLHQSMRLGNVVSVSGNPGKSKKDVLSVFASSVTVLDTVTRTVFR